MIEKQNKMTLLSIILIVISFQSVAFSSQITFTKNRGKVFVETDPEHFAMYGQVTDKDGVRVIVVDRNNHYYQTSKCESEWERLKDINQDHARDYRKIRDEYSTIKGESPEISKIPSERYTWSTNLSKQDDVKYSAVRLDYNTVVFSSRFFPGDLAKLIYSGDLVIFVHYDGRVIIKRWDCMYLNEKILIRATNQNLVDQGGLRLFIQSRDQAFKKFLEKNQFNEQEFDNEQKFIRTYTYAEYAAMQKAVLAQGSGAINGHRAHMEK